MFFLSLMLSVKLRMEISSLKVAHTPLNANSSEKMSLSGSLSNRA